MARIEISPEAADYIREKRFQRPNVIVYRDIESISCCSSKVFEFIPKVKVLDGKEPNEYFAIVGSSGGIPVWIEKALISGLDGAVISARKGLLKGLKIEARAKSAKETFSK